MLDDFLVKSIADEDHAYIFLFVWWVSRGLARQGQQQAAPLTGRAGL
jgi:hypothetical protein